MLLHTQGRAFASCTAGTLGMADRAASGAVADTHGIAQGRVRPGLRLAKIQTLGGLDAGRCLGRHKAVRYSLQPFARPGVSVDRLRALYMSGARRRRRTGRAVVGERKSTRLK